MSRGRRRPTGATVADRSHEKKNYSISVGSKVRALALQDGALAVATDAGVLRVFAGSNASGALEAGVKNQLGQHTGT